MSSTNYPSFTDTSFEAFSLVSEADQVAVFGRTYSQSELVPVSYAKLLDAYINGAITRIPIREIYYTRAIDNIQYNNEAGKTYQSDALTKCLESLFSTYQTYFVYDIAMGVVTELTQEIQHIAGANDIQIKYKAKVLWFSIPNGLYA